MNLHEIEEAIRQLEQGSCTYNNCMKLASLYIVRDELEKKGDMNYNYRYRPMYNRNHREPMYYTDDLMIGREHNMYEQDRR